MKDHFKSCLKQITWIKYKDGADITKHLNNFQGLINQATTLNLNLDDEVQALLLFSSLPDNQEKMMISISNLALNGLLTMDISKEVMMNEELKKKEQGIVNESQTLVTEKKEGQKK